MRQTVNTIYMKHMKHNILALALPAVLLMAACNPWAEQEKSIDPTMEQPIMEVMKSMPELSRFVSLLEATHYDEVLQRAQSYTVFAPENEAWPSTAFDTVAYIKNHIAWQTFSMNDGAFDVDHIQMINGKNVPVSGDAIGLEKVKVNSTITPAQNGLVYTIGSLVEPRLNIWEYVADLYEDYMPVTVIKENEQKVMDMNLSYQLYLDEMGRPVYDTAWNYVNEWLDTYSLDNEDSSYTFVYVPETVISRLRVAYRPYFTVKVMDEMGIDLEEDEEATDQLVDQEIAKDMILACQEGAEGDFLLSKNGVKVKFGAVTSVYRASNGYVYELKDVDIKMYENKVKTLYLEAENYYSITSSHGVSDASQRVKSWARGGYDLMLAGLDYFTNTSSSDNDSKNHYTTLVNSSLEYRPVLNSVPYQVYMMAYDDTKGTIASGDTLTLSYKLLASMPGKPQLVVKSTGAFDKNFDDTLVFVAQNNARNHAEQLFMLWSTDNTTSLYADEQIETHPDYQIDQLPCSSYGEACLRLATCAFDKTIQTIYLDYLKLVPVVDPDK